NLLCRLGHGHRPFGRRREGTEARDGRVALLGRRGRHPPDRKRTAGADRRLSEPAGGWTMTLGRRSLLAAGLALPVASAAAAGAREVWTRPAGLAPDGSIALWPDGHIAAPPRLAERTVQRSEDPQ